MVRAISDEEICKDLVEIGLASNIEECKKRIKISKEDEERLEQIIYEVLREYNMLKITIT